MTQTHETLEVRESMAGDAAALEALYPEAFPEEDLLPVLRALLKAGSEVLSLTATVRSGVVGHGAFTTCGVAGTDGRVAMLAPLAVAPASQRKGIGGAIVRAGLKRLRDAGICWVYVLGDPAYYGRFGFRPERRLAPPYPLPEEWRDAWQSVTSDDAVPPPEGQIQVPDPWRDPALWSA